MKAERRGGERWGGGRRVGGDDGSWNCCPCAFLFSQTNDPFRRETTQLFMGHYTIVKNTITQEWEEGFFFRCYFFTPEPIPINMKLMLKHQQRNYFFIHFHTWVILHYCDFFYFYTGPDKPDNTSSNRQWEPWSLITACVLLHRPETFLWPFSLMKDEGASWRVLGKVTFILERRGGKERKKGKKKKTSTHNAVLIGA